MTHWRVGKVPAFTQYELNQVVMLEKKAEAGKAEAEASVDAKLMADIATRANVLLRLHEGSKEEATRLQAAATATKAAAAAAARAAAGARAAHKQMAKATTAAEAAEVRPNLHSVPGL
jgi:hypothetical protein